MNLAGKYLSTAQSVAESALLAPLRAKYSLPLNLVKLSQDAKQLLIEKGVAINPYTLRQAANEIASMQSTMLEDVIGTTQEIWNPVTKSFEEYVIPDTRKDFII